MFTKSRHECVDDHKKDGRRAKQRGDEIQRYIKHKKYCDPIVYFENMFEIVEEVD